MKDIFKTCISIVFMKTRYIARYDKIHILIKKIVLLKMLNYITKYVKKCTFNIYFVKNKDENVLSWKIDYLARFAVLPFNYIYNKYQ